MILAAGAGARLGGRCKAALRLPDGRTFLQSVLDAARGAPRIVVVTGGPHAAETARLAADANVPAVENPDAEQGMISSLVRGLDALGDVEAALSWPVDHAFVEEATADAVLAAAARERIVIPTWRGRGGHPTAFGADFFAALRRASTAREVVTAAGAAVVRLPVDDAGVLRDVDGVEDLP